MSHVRQARRIVLAVTMLLVCTGMASAHIARADAPALAFEAALNPVTGQVVALRSVEAGSILSASPGLLFELPDAITVDAQGIAAEGQGAAQLRWEGASWYALRAVYSPGFRIQETPLRIAGGRITLYDGAQRIAEIGPSGLEIFAEAPDVPITDLVLPPTLSLAGGLATLSLPADVAITQRGSDYRITPGGPLSLEVRGFSAPLSAAVEALVLGPDLSVRSVTLVAEADGSALAGADGLFAVSRVALSTARGLSLDVAPRLFGRDDLVAPLTVRVGPDGRADASVSADVDGVLLPLVEGSDAVAFRLGTLGGRIQFDLNGGVPSAAYDVEGAFEIAGTPTPSQARPLAARVPVTLRYAEGRATMDAAFSTDAFARFGAALEAGSFAFTFAPSALALTWQEGGGWTFEAEARVGLSVTPEGAEPFAVTLPRVTLTPQGLAFPRIDLDGLALDPVPLGAAELRVTGLAMPPATFDAWRFEQGDLVNLAPTFALALRLPGLAARAPALAERAFVLENVGFADGVLTGALPTTTFARPPTYRVGDMTVAVESVGGRLGADDSGAQTADLDLAGSITAAAFGTNPDGSPCEANAALSLEGAGLSGAVEGFAGCGAVRLGALDATFTGGTLSLSVDASGAQQARLEGGAMVTLAEVAGLDAEPATGTLVLDLIAGEIATGSVDFGEATWRVPAAEPLVTLAVPSLRMSGGVLAIGGTGGVMPGQESASAGLEAEFEAVRIGTDGTWRGGSVRLGGGAALRIGTAPLAFGITTTGDSLGGAGARLSLPSGTRLTKDGLTLDGSLAAALQVLDGRVIDVAAEASSFTLGIGPLRVAEGEVAFQAAGTTLATLGPGGFSFATPGDLTDLALGVLPDVLRLGGLDLGALRLAAPDGTPLVQAFDQGDGTYRLEALADTRAVFSFLPFGDAVLTGMDGGLDAALDYLVVRAEDFGVVDGSFSVTIPEGDTRFQLPGAPVRLTGFGFSLDDGLYLDAAHALFAGLVETESTTRLRVTPEGLLEATLEQGTTRLDGSGLTLPDPIASLDFIPGSDKLRLDVQGFAGTLRIPLVDGLGAPDVGLPDFDYRVDAALVLTETLRDGEGTALPSGDLPDAPDVTFAGGAPGVPSLRIPLTLAYDRTGASLSALRDALADLPTLDVGAGPFRLGVRLQDLDLGFTPPSLPGLPGSGGGSDRGDTGGGSGGLGGALEGWDFGLDLGLDLVAVASDGTTWSTSLDGVTLSPDGFVFPDITLDDLALPPFRLGPVELRLDGLTLPAATFDWFSGAGSDASGDESDGGGGFGFPIRPRYDFALTLPGFADSAPSLAEQEIALTDFSFTDGFLSGTIPPFELPEMARLRLGAVDLGLSEVFGGLSAPNFGGSDGEPDGEDADDGDSDSDGGSGFGLPGISAPDLGQLFDIRFKGTLGGPLFSSLFGESGDDGSEDSDSNDDGSGFGLPNLPDLPDIPFPDTGYDGGSCTADFEVGLDGFSGVQGTITDFVPCGRMYVGPVQIGFVESELVFRMGLDAQEATLSGGLAAGFRESGGFSGAEAQGRATLDLVGGALLDSDITFTGLTWQYPTADPAAEPFFTFRVPEATIQPDRVVLTGEGVLDVGEGASITARLDSTRVGFDGEIASGDVILSGDLALRTPLGSGLDWRLTSASDSTLSSGAQAFMQVDDGTTVVLDANGLTISGSGSGGLQLPDGDDGTPGETFAPAVQFDDFRLSVDPAQVASGRADLVVGGATVAYFDADGFALGSAEELITAALAGLPDEIPLGHPRVGRLRLREAGQWLVDVSRLPSGALRLSALNGASPKLRLPTLTDRTFAVTLGGLTLDATTFLPIDGSVRVDISGGTASSGGDAPGVGSEGFAVPGLPFDLTALGFDLADGLYFEGFPDLFGDRDPPDAPAGAGQRGEPTRLAIGTDGRLAGEFEISGLNRVLRLVPDSDRLTLRFDGFSGSLDFDLLGASAPSFDFDIPATFAVANAAGEMLMETGLTLRHGESFTDLAELDIRPGQAARAALDFGAFTFDFALADLDLSRENGTWQFAADLDFALEANASGAGDADGSGSSSGGASWRVPLRGVSLTPAGFVFPRQEVLDATGGGRTGFDLPPFRLGPVELSLLALRLPEPVRFDWFDFDPGDLMALVPRYDFALSLPGFAETAPALAGASFTFQDVSFENGLLNGDLLPFTFDEIPSIPLGDGLAFNLETVFGGLAGGDASPSADPGRAGGASGGGQGFGLRFGGSIDFAGLFRRDGSGGDSDGGDPNGSGDVSLPNIGVPDAGYRAGECEQQVELGLAGDFGFGGTVENIAPCGRLFVGPITLGFSESTLDFELSNNDQRVILSGAVEAGLDASGGFSGATATGSVVVDLLGMEVIESDVVFSSVTWQLPAADPLLTFAVPTVAFTPGGIDLSGSGRLDLGEGAEVTASFDGARVGFDGALESGAVQVTGGFSLGTMLDEVDWTLGAASDALQSGQEGTRMLLTVDAGQSGEGGAVLTPDGFVLSAGGSAGLLIDRTAYVADLALDGFTFGFSPVRVDAGTATLRRASDDVLLATVSSDGIELGDLAALIPIPDRLALPNQATAYLQLRDDADEPLVEIITDEGTGARTLQTLDGETVTFILASLEDDAGQSPAFDLAFALEIDDAFSVVGGRLDYLPETPFSLEPYGLPLDLTALSFAAGSGASDGDGFDLTAGVRVALGGADSDFELNAGALLTFDEDGFREARLQDGTYAETFDADYATSNPPLARWDATDDLAIHIYGLDLDFDRDRYRLSGSLASPYFTGGTLPDPASGDGVLHVTASYEEGAWRFTGNDDHLPDGLALGDQARIKLGADGLALSYESDGAFALDLSGVMTLASLGDDFRLALDEFHLGTDGARVNASFDGAEPQQVHLFERALTLNLTEGSVALDGFDVVVSASGLLETSFSTSPATAQDRAAAPAVNAGGAVATACSGGQEGEASTEVMRFEDLVVGTDGTFSLGGGAVNLLAGRAPVQIVPGMVCVNTLAVETVPSPSGTGVLSGGTLDLRLSLGLLAEVPNLRDPCRRDPDGAQCAAAGPQGSDAGFTLEGQVIVGTDGHYDGALYAVLDDVQPSASAGKIKALRPAPGGYRPAANGSLGELEVGGKAVFELTGLGIDLDLYDPYNTEITATAALHVYTDKAQSKVSKGRTVRNGQARAQRGRSYKTLTFGNPYRLDDPENQAVRFTLPRPPTCFAEGTCTEGFAVPLPSVDFDLALSLPGLPDLPDVNLPDAPELPAISFPALPELLIDFEFGAFSLGLYQLQFDAPTFSFDLSGLAALSMPNVEGLFSFDGLRFGFDPLTFDIGRFTGPFAFDLKNTLAFEMGCLDVEQRGDGEAGLSLTRTIGAGDNATSETVSDLDFYVRLAQCGGSETAASVSIGSAFSGSIDEVLYYETTGGATSLLVENAQIELRKGLAEMNVGFEYTGGDGEFEIGISGGGTLGVGASATRLTATGTLGYRDGAPSFGVFLAKTGGTPVPIVPGTVDLMGVGGGFFYRPQAKHLRRVYDALGDDVQINNPNGLPRAEDLTMAILLYADVGVGGTFPAYAMRGNGLVTITDQFFNADVSGYLMPRGDAAESELSATGYLTVLYGEDQSGVQGGFTVDMDYKGPVPVLVTDDAKPIRMDFAYINPKGGAETWFVKGDGQVKLFQLVTLDGAVLASDAGFLAQVGASASLDAGIVEAKGRVGLDFWYNTAQEEIGAYAEIRAEASVLGGLAEIGANMRGAVLASGDGYLLYAGASAYVEVLFVFDGSVDIWMALENGRARGGTGRNARYEAMVANSRALLGEMEDKAASAEAATDVALTSLDVPSAGESFAPVGDGSQFLSSNAEQVRAGVLLAQGTEAERKAAANAIPMPSGETAIARRTAYTGAPPALRLSSSVEALREQIEAEIEAGRAGYEATVADLRLLLSEIEALADAPTLEASPVQREGDTFTIDTALGDQQENALTTYRADISSLEATYAERLEQMETALDEVDALLDGASGATPYVAKFGTALGLLGQDAHERDRTLRTYRSALASWYATRDAALGTEPSSDLRVALFDQLGGIDPRVTNGDILRCCEVDDETGQIAARSDFSTDDPEAFGASIYAGDASRIVRESFGEGVSVASPDRRNAIVRMHRLSDLAARRRALVQRLAGGTPSGLRCDLEREVQMWGTGACPGDLADQGFGFGNSYTDVLGPGWSGDLPGNYRMFGRFHSANLRFRAGVLGSTPQLRGVAFEEGQALLHTIPRALIDEQLRVGLERSAIDLGANYYANFAGLANDYTARTSTVDSLYARKAVLVEKLAGMYDQYAVYLREQGEDAAADASLEQRQALLAELAPPSLAYLRADVEGEATDAGKAGAGAEGTFVELDWGARNASGSVVTLRDSTEGAAYGYRGASLLGEPVNQVRGGGLRHYVMPRDSADTEATVTVGVALRNRAGALFPPETRAFTVPLHPDLTPVPDRPKGDGTGGGGLVSVLTQDTGTGSADAYTKPVVERVDIALPGSAYQKWAQEWTRFPVEMDVTNPSGGALTVVYRIETANGSLIAGIGDGGLESETWTASVISGETGEVIESERRRYPEGARLMQVQTTAESGDTVTLFGEVALDSDVLRTLTHQADGLRVRVQVRNRYGTLSDWRASVSSSERVVFDPAPPTEASTASGWRMAWHRRIATAAALDAAGLGAASVPARDVPPALRDAYAPGAASIRVTKASAPVDPEPVSTLRASGLDETMVWVTDQASAPTSPDGSTAFGAGVPISADFAVGAGGRAHLHAAAYDVARNARAVPNVLARTYGPPVPPTVSLEPDPSGGARVSLTQPDDGWRVLGYQIACASGLGTALSGKGEAARWAFSGADAITHTAADALGEARSGGALAFAVPSWPCALYVRPVYQGFGAGSSGGAFVYAHARVLADATPPAVSVELAGVPEGGTTPVRVTAFDAESGLKALRYRTRARSTESSGGTLGPWQSVPNFDPAGRYRDSTDALGFAAEGNPVEVQVEARSWAGSRASAMLRLEDATLPAFALDAAPRETGRGLGLTFAGLHDPETSITSAAYRLRLVDPATADTTWKPWRDVALPAGTDFRTPRDLDVDAEWSGAQALAGLEVEATNGIGRTRRIARTARELPDFSAPVVRLSEAAVTAGRAALRLSFAELFDPESSVARVDVRVRPAGGTFGAWRSGWTASGARYEAETAELSVATEGGVEAEVRAVNGFGLTSPPLAFDLTAPALDASPPTYSGALAYAEAPYRSSWKPLESRARYRLTTSACDDGESGVATARARLVRSDSVRTEWTALACEAGGSNTLDGPLPDAPATAFRRSSGTVFYPTLTGVATAVYRYAEVEVTDRAGNAERRNLAIPSDATPPAIAGARVDLLGRIWGVSNGDSFVMNDAIEVFVEVRDAESPVTSVAYRPVFSSDVPAPWYTVGLKTQSGFETNWNDLFGDAGTAAILRIELRAESAGGVTVETIWTNPNAPGGTSP